VDFSLKTDRAVTISGFCSHATQTQAEAGVTALVDIDFSVRVYSAATDVLVDSAAAFVRVGETPVASGFTLYSSGPLTPIETIQLPAGDYYCTSQIAAGSLSGSGGFSNIAVGGSNITVSVGDPI